MKTNSTGGVTENGNTLVGNGVSALPDRPSYGLSLRANFSWTLLGNVVYGGCQWGMLVLLAKLTSTDQVGTFALALAICTPIIAFANLQLRAVQATDARHLYVFGDYLGLRIITTIVALLIISAVAVIGYGEHRALIIAAVALTKAFEAISDVCYGLFQQAERMNLISYSMAIKGPLSLIGMGVGLVTTDSLFWGVLGLALAKCLVLFAYDVPTVTRLLRDQNTKMDANPAIPQPQETAAPRWEMHSLLNLTGLSMPLGMAGLILSLRANIPRYFIEYYRTASELGIYAALAALMAAGHIIINALGQAACPRLAKLYAASDSKSFRRILFKMIALGVLIGGIGVLIATTVGKPVLSLLYTPEYAEHVDLLVLIAVVGGIGYATSFLGYARTAMRIFRPGVVAEFMGTVMTVLFAYLWIPRHGPEGAPFALLTGIIVTTIANIVIIWHGFGRISGETAAR